MAGYSGTPLLTKLGIRDAHRVAFPGAPDNFAETLGYIPPTVRIKQRTVGPLDVIVFFTRREAELERRFEAMKRALDPDGGLWIAWPKRVSAVESDLNEDAIRRLALQSGLVDNKVCAIDETWSGLRLVYRLADRDGLRAAS